MTLSLLENSTIVRPRSDRLSRSIQAAIDWLWETQDSSGFWVGMVESNSTIEAEWLLASYIVGFELPSEKDVIGALLQRQRPDGSWGTYPGAPDGDINSTVEVYAALRAKGFDPNCDELVRARAWILEHDAIRNLRVFTRYWLAMVGVWPWEHTPNLPPEIIRLPLWFPFNIYNFAQWARATMVPLTVVAARTPVRPLPGGSKLEELFPCTYEDLDFSIPAKRARTFSLEWLFLKIDRGLHKAQRLKLIPFRENSIKLCLEWMIRHQDADGGWGGIQPPWIYGLIALINEGYTMDHPVVSKAIGALTTHWSYERNGATHIQASESPVWDTLLAILALHEAGVSSDKTEVRKALEWALNQQVLVPGDWAIKIKNVRPGGWAFERANNHYPDVDDTAVALLVLGKLRSTIGELRPRVERAIELGVEWTLAMQCRNGGWAAFDKDNDKEIISKIPFCNFGEAIDPPSVDVTGHVIEAFAALGYDKNHPAIRRALDYIRSEQEEAGSWFGRWGVNHIYGTAAVLPALKAIGEDMTQPYVLRAIAWILSRQNDDGGWGETCASYMDPELRGRGPSTPSQTAWGLMCLLSVNASPEINAALRNGVEHLCSTQKSDGTWDEDYYTATGFPGYGIGARTNSTNRLQQGTELSRGFMLSFNMYRHYFPLLALARIATNPPR
ncbi:squalene-hopene/tetraprenyl-beta-curcumene cyclase [Bradyrhizobium japonicum]|uniref:squalene--hopene cyclase n=1 Tax=Bradyrhizobium elkanii TaxID=29448 RepID=UPI00039CAF4A|nr:squalene--hopene cyclase [Bradyrhizobium elkanii]MBP2435226.1 squalene-hopene/tetraprenyl-beta-curcumene cyclase [Bradyrhizobium elkanii]MCP1737612.1 squalene-hopene/tetraprenyl-beta-curcumene cyclase [Bradyrhizobium elkanii]MCS3576169.1 squalene-hopene/tetraprenyl-beta-curcumene cyclase [Bradyrhizobium elkanii]MCS3594496.1 squalene-hopene/tetraprenyl-beta-curcumene cyclase [Bradyrhizobium elkanii]MCS3626085.1 squalene-hopene/tetraprenyl-beta-curcumene cyclase [Bradyrhizobium elkanii]